jgi:DNA-binding XRE family transcriptional regulator
MMESHIETEVMNNLKEIRKAKKFSVWGLAVRAKTSATTVSAIERWGYRPGKDLSQRIAAALNVKVADIWPNEEPAA